MTDPAIIEAEQALRHTVKLLTEAYPGVSPMSDHTEAHSLNRAIANGQLKRLNAERAVLEAKIALCNARLAQIDLWLDAAETICPGILSKLGYAVEEPRP